MAKTVSFEIAFAPQKESHPKKIVLAQQVPQDLEKTQIEESTSQDTFSSSQIPG